MSGINKLSCTTAIGGNTGIGSCAFDPDKITGALIVPLTFKVTYSESTEKYTWDATEYDTAIEAFQASTLAVASKRAYPIWKFQLITDNSETGTVTTSGYGDKSYVKEGKYDWTFQLSESFGSVCFLKRLRMFNDLKNYGVVFFDDKNRAIGTLTTDSDGIAPLTLEFFHAEPFKIADGSNRTIYSVRFALADPSELNDYPAFIELESIATGIKGIIDVTLKSASAATAGHAFVKLETTQGGVDIYDSFSTELADVDAWILTKAGVSKTITGVTKSDSLKGWNIASAETGDCVIALAPPDELAASGIGVGGGAEYGYEGSNTLAVTLPT